LTDVQHLEVLLECTLQRFSKGNEIVRDQIFEGIDLYANFNFDESQIDMQGWGSDHPILPWTIENLRPDLIIEVGSWKGRSAINMAKKMESLDIDGEILCIDTWLGSPEHWLENQYKGSLKIINGRPNLYNTFITNVIANKCEKYITPFPLTSEAAYFVLKKLGVKSSMIYIDAGHEYESVIKDIEMYWDLLGEGGVMILDDYIGWSGVTKAINEFALKNNLQPFGEPGKAVLNKNSKLQYSTKIVF
jgi:hypothetical protein